MKLYIQSGSAICYPYNHSEASFTLGDFALQMNLQFGHGMMSHTRHLLNEWGGGGVILSPRDLTNEQLQRVAGEVAGKNTDVLLDPQCYVHGADHARLMTHDYFRLFSENSTNAFSGGPATAELLESLAKLARSMNIRHHIIPGLLARPVSEDWFAVQETMLSEAPAHFGGDDLYATVALSSDALRNENQVESVVDRAAHWNVAGYYLVAETPDPYLVSDPNWMANLLILASGLKLTGRTVIVGYCSHQMLCLSVAGIDSIASGTWINVRAFPPEKFNAPEQDEISRRTIWYYCPQALSEYKIPFLDIAQRTGMLSEMRPQADFASTYSDPLFGGAVPSTVVWGEQNAFRHYLTCLRSQALQAHHKSFQEALDYHRRQLDAAQSRVEIFAEHGILGQYREFNESIADACRSALSVLERARGPQLRHQWIGNT